MKLLIHMKSGKTITVRGVKKWNYESNNSKSDIRLIIDRRRFTFGSVLILQTLDLSEVEAIEYVPTFFFKWFKR